MPVFGARKKSPRDAEGNIIKSPPEVLPEVSVPSMPFGTEVFVPKGPGSKVKVSEMSPEQKMQYKKNYYTGWLNHWDKMYKRAVRDNDPKAQEYAMKYNVVKEKLAITVNEGVYLTRKDKKFNYKTGNWIID